jgi:preprotein translocase SecE subunit
MPSKQRYVFIGAMGLAAVIGLALSQGFAWAWSQASLANPTPLGTSDLPLTTLLGYAVAFGGTAIALRNQAAHTWASEVVDELTRVAWPSREETGNATLVVIVAVLVCSAYLGMFDAFWLSMTDFILGVPAVDAVS